MTELLRYRDVTRVTYYRDLLEQSGIRTFIRNENLSTSEGVSIPDFFPALCILNEADKQLATDLIKADLAHREEPEAPERICRNCKESSPANFDTCWKCGSSISPP
jgi:ribosomal protein L40E